MTRFKFSIISLLILAVFSVGWRTSPTRLAGEFGNPVNMSLMDTLLLVSDSDFGVHVYNVADPAAPVFKYLIPMEGNNGSAAKGNIVYASDNNSFKAIRIDPDTFTVVKTIELWEEYRDPMPVFGPVDQGWGWGCGCNEYDAVPTVADGGGSVGSSYATFAIIDSYLYYFHHPDLVTMDISTPENPVELSRKHMDWGVETLYPTDEYLFMGGTTGMYIYDRSSPASPVQIGRIEHFEACDPVVVSGDLAYVTLRGGNRCGATMDILMVVNISNPNQPYIMSETDVKTPYGLAIDFPMLYVSTGHNGFKLFDATDADAPAAVVGWESPDTKDFIWYEDLLYVMGFDAVTIYNVADPEVPSRLSLIQ
jgi:hypothetical protein